MISEHKRSLLMLRLRLYNANIAANGTGWESKAMSKKQNASLAAQKTTQTQSSHQCRFEQGLHPLSDP